MKLSYQEALTKTGQNKSQTTSTNNVVNFFSLKEDWDVAIVRFAYPSEEPQKEFDVVTSHKVEELNPTTKKTMYRTISCLRTPYAPISDCPFCEAKIPLSTRFFVKLYEYTIAEDGSVVSHAKVWDRPIGFASTLMTLFNEYGTDNVFKIVRHGKRGDTSTTYDILLVSPKIYNPEVYKLPEEDIFKNYDLSKKFYSVKTREDMQYFCEHKQFPQNYKSETVEHLDNKTVNDSTNSNDTRSTRLPNQTTSAPVKRTFVY